MAVNVQEIQNRIGAGLDQVASVTAGAEDWDLRLKYINMAQTEWSQFYDWQVLYKEYNTLTSTSTGNTSISLPSDFRKLASFPKVVYDGTNTSEYEEVRPQERTQKVDTDKYQYIMGNDSDGYTMVINSGNADRQLPSGASIFISYYATAGSLASPTDISPIPDANYLVHRALAYIFQSADDTRFQIELGEADKLLARMLEREAVHSEAANDYSRIRTVEEKRYGFRIGRD